MNWICDACGIEIEGQPYLRWIIGQGDNDDLLEAIKTRPFLNACSEPCATAQGVRKRRIWEDVDYIEAL